MNEFGEIAIDTKVIEGKNVRIAELGGGCVCCSLLGEFEAAVNEIIEKIAPERIVVETTGLAEPEALVFNIQEALPQCRLDGVVSVIDADMLIRFPELGHTTRLQIEGADKQHTLTGIREGIGALAGSPLRIILKEARVPLRVYSCD